MKDPVFQRGTGVVRELGVERGVATGDENRLKLVGLMTPDIPLTGPMFVYVNSCTRSMFKNESISVYSPLNKSNIKRFLSNWNGSVYLSTLSVQVGESVISAGSESAADDSSTASMKCGFGGSGADCGVRRTQRVGCPTVAAVRRRLTRQRWRP